MEKKKEKQKKEVIIILNDGTRGKVDAPGKIIGSILYFFLHKLNKKVHGQYLISIDGVKDILLGATELAECYFALGKSVNLTRQILKIRSMVENENNRDVLMQYIYETVLTSDGLPTLPGFGMVNVEHSEEGRRRVKGLIAINPEKSSIYQ